MSIGLPRPADDAPPGWWSNPDAVSWVGPGTGDGATAFHAGIDGYAPTALIDLPALAEELGVGRVLAKDESSRFGLSAFKVLGVSWATHQALAARLGIQATPLTVADLRLACSAAGPVELVTATDGNHGRALAWMARRLGLPARVVVPDTLPPAVVDAIRDQGATVVAMPVDYDEAVRQAARLAEASPDALLIQDTAWPGYEQVPQWIVDGYATMFREIDAQLRDAGLPDADLVAVPIGVGSLAQAAVAHARRGPSGTATRVLGVEPDSAACVLASVMAGRLRSIPTGQTVMNGLNCGTPSSLAWPYLRSGLDATVAIPDDAADRAGEDLAALGISSGPSGAAALAGVRVALSGEGHGRRRAELGLTRASTVVLLNTEGVIRTQGGDGPSQWNHREGPRA